MEKAGANSSLYITGLPKWYKEWQFINKGKTWSTNYVDIACQWHRTCYEGLICIDCNFSYAEYFI
jgi:hypothetical protein